MATKKILQDFIYSFFSIGISIIILQLLVYPYLSRKLSIDDYGALIAIIGVTTAIYQTFGGALSQTRLIKNRFYKMKGDFVLLISLSCVVVGIITVIFTKTFWDGGFRQIVLNVLFVVLSTYNAYAIVIFRIKIDYKKYFISNVLIGVGYIFGVIYHFFGGPWQFVFIFAQLFLVIYLFFSSDVIQEPFNITSNFKFTLITFLWLLFSGGLSNSVQYLDKFLIYPILGGDNASIFFASTYFAKSLSMVMLPISNVLLSYISSGKIIFDRRKFIYLTLATFFVCLAFSVVIYLLVLPVTQLFFPTLAVSAIPYFLISNVAILLGIAYGIIGLPMLIYAPTYWQLILNIVQLIVYFSLALYWSAQNGLMGFCFAMLISNSLRLLISISISWYYLRNKDMDV